MSRDTNVIHNVTLSQYAYHRFHRWPYNHIDQLLITQMVQNQRARAIREASLQSIELLAPALDGRNLRVLPCCCEQAAFQHVRHAGKGQGIHLE